MSTNGSSSNSASAPDSPSKPLTPQRAEPTSEVLLRHAARTLDPTRAARFDGQDLQSTVYAGTQLIIRATPDREKVEDKLREVAKARGLWASFNEVDEQLYELAREAGVDLAEDGMPLLIRVRLEPHRSASGPLDPPDSWKVLQAYRAKFLRDRRNREAVQLDHVLTPSAEATPYWHSAGSVNPYWHSAGAANPYWHAAGTPYWHSGTGTPYWHAGGDREVLGEYAVPGFGGRTPVTWVGPSPAERDPADVLYRGRRRPVVAVLDTGVGRHPWLPDAVVDRHPRCGTLHIGLPCAPGGDDHSDLAVDPLTGELAKASGHGTFVAGLVRQRCPEANILSVRVVQPDGFVAEVDLLLALNMLWLRQRLALARNEPEKLIDVVSMSLGYYHEEIGDDSFDPLLLAPIRALSRLGVVVVVSAGNDATQRPMFPAAFAPWSHGPVRAPRADEVPVVAVGASNPDGSVALFSNDGPWVSAYRPGAAVVSTVPPYDGSRAPSLETARGRDGLVRSTIDPDDFTSGFATWSGTSFAAPIMAGQIAQHLMDGDAAAGEPAPEPGRRDRRRTALVRAREVGVARGWDAVHQAVPGLSRPR